MSKIIRLIEDNADDASLYRELLEAVGDIKIEPVDVCTRPTTSDYTDLIADAETGAIIIDERLGEYGGVNYTGLQLADFLRTLRPEIPIYILTNYPGDISDDQGESVEFVIDKKTVRKKAKVYVARILRHMQQYEAALTEQQRRLKNLIDRKLTDGLNNEEEEELKQLRAKIERPSGPAIIDEENKWIERERKQEEDLRRQEELLERLEKIVQKNQDLSNA